MDNLVLFCKSYRRDMYRARRLAESIRLFNADQIPFYVSVPETDLGEFKHCFGDLVCRFLTDEEILAKSSEVFGPLPALFPPHLLQQLVKLEFWRQGLCRNYVWLDSDSYFLKEFRVVDFMFDDETPHTVRHKSKELLDFADKIGDLKIRNDLLQMTGRLQEAFNRNGEWYDFGGPPLIWSSAVLQSLSDDYLIPSKKSIYELLVEYPCEMQLYGEYLLYSKNIPLKPIEPLFKIYHYAGQFFLDQENGLSDRKLSGNYLGVIYQSNWARLPEKKKPASVRLKKFIMNLLRQLDHLRLKIKG